MFERFTSRARAIVVLAQVEARAFNHNYIGTEHLLLGLIKEGEGVAVEALQALGVNLETIRQQVEEKIDAGTQARAASGHIPFTPRAKKVLEFSLREALQLGHNYIGTEHILLGLIREDDGVAAQIMSRHATLREIRVAVLDAVPLGNAGESESEDEATNAVLRWLRQRLRPETRPGVSRGATAGEDLALRLTPASQITLSEATRLAG